MPRKHFFEGKQVNNFSVGELKDGKFICTCACGNIRYIKGYDLNIGRYRSCGCFIDQGKPEYEEYFKKKFWSQVVKRENNCHEWSGLTRGGYGRINYNGKTQGCTRIIWEWNKGKIPKDMIICHHCDNPSCVNIDHLFLGTKLDNMQDCIRKGRKIGIEGEKNHNSKLNNKIVLKIRKLKANGIKHKDIAQMLKINISNIKNVITRKTWKHVQ